jgi:Na+-driven multidrug efflux pump
MSILQATFKAVRTSASVLFGAALILWLVFLALAALLFCADGWDEFSWWRGTEAAGHWIDGFIGGITVSCVIGLIIFDRARRRWQAEYFRRGAFYGAIRGQTGESTLTEKQK